MENIARTAKQTGDAIRRRRKSLGLTQRDVSAKAGLRQPTVSALEAGEGGVKLSTLFDILSALGLELIIRPRSKTSAKDIEEIF